MISMVYQDLAVSRSRCGWYFDSVNCPKNHAALRNATYACSRRLKGSKHSLSSHHSDIINDRWIQAHRRLHLPQSQFGLCCSATSDQACSSGDDNEYDLVTLSNLCVDVLVSLDELPDDEDDTKRMSLLEELSGNPPSQESWEVGGNTNTLIAAARLGMRVGALGLIGEDSFGTFLTEVLKAEGTGIVSGIVDRNLLPGRDHAFETLACFVLVNTRTNEHSFCSKYDFGPWPLFWNVHSLCDQAVDVLSRARTVFVNGFVFDEIPEELVVQAVHIAHGRGAAVIFDPGPRSWTFKEGVRRHALDTMLDIADIVLMTEEEAGAVIGIEDAEEAVKRLMSRPTRKNTKWVIIKQGERGALLGDAETGELYHQEGYSVPVEDTVGCGDSFAAAIALGFAKGTDIRSMLALAGAVGAATAMGRGAGRNVATVARVEQILLDHLDKHPESAAKIHGALGMIVDDKKSLV